jgi:hypothetical protein
VDDGRKDIERWAEGLGRVHGDLGGGEDSVTRNNGESGMTAAEVNGDARSVHELFAINKHHHSCFIAIRNKIMFFSVVFTL